MLDSQNSSAPWLSWVHFGDLHVQKAEDENYQDFLQLIEEANHHLTGEVDFAFLPGDNADDGTASQYQLVRSALDRLTLPVHSIPGDYDKKSGTLAGFQQYLERELYRARNLKGFQLLFLNALDGREKDDFACGPEQLRWLEGQLREAAASGLRPLLFTHLYPSELDTGAETLTRLIREFRVDLVEMGHTHYNELANDGQTIYAATRSTGQIEEGPPGFSLTTIDGDVISWKFKERGSWPFVMMTSPADQQLITKPHSPQQVLRGVVPIRAKVWGSPPVQTMTYSVDGSPARPLQFGHGHWEGEWNSAEVPDGTHRLSVQATTEKGGTAGDSLSILVSQSGYYEAPPRSAIDYENAIGPYEEKSILGTQLGPNENGTKGPWPSWQGKP